MKNIKVCVIGQGYIGLPTAAIIASKGIEVAGVDVRKEVVDTINKGEIHIKEPALAGLVKHDVSEGYLKAATAPGKADIFLITVPTPFIEEDKTPDLSYVENAIESILPHLSPGNLVIIESTCPVGTTTSMHNYIIEKRPELEGKLYMAYCPERVLPGNIIYELEYNDRVIGGINEVSTKKAIEFYRIFVKGELLATSDKAAEMCKLTENAYRDVNIAFANEISMICEQAGIDPYDLIKLANHHPRVNILQPGPGVGGHCIAVDPWFLISNFKSDAGLMKTARETNLKKTTWVINKIKEAIEDFKSKENKEPVVACMGLAFKPNVDDLRESPAIEIYKYLQASEKNVIACEPNLRKHEVIELFSVENAVSKADIIVLLVAHNEFKSLNIPVEKEVLKFCNIN